MEEKLDLGVLLCVPGDTLGTSTGNDFDCKHIDFMLISINIY